MALMRSDTWLITVEIGGVLAPAPDGVWDNFKGGDVDSVADIYHAGGMKDQEAVGGIASISTVTVEKAVDITNDWPFVTGLMAAQAGKEKVRVHRQPLDIDKNPTGPALIYSGILKSVAPGDTDSSKSDIQMWTITVVVNGPIGIA
jgi:hypothetical protein